MHNSINPINPMIPPELVDTQDYGRTGEVFRLCNEFNRAVVTDLIRKGRGMAVINEMTQDEVAEMQFIAHTTAAMNLDNDADVAEVEMLGIILRDIFTGIIARVEPDDDEIAQHIPAAMANEDTALYFEKYEMPALAYFVRKAIP